MDAVDEVKMLALRQTLFYFGLFDVDLWNLYYCNSFLYALKPLNTRVKEVFPAALDFRVQIRHEYRNTIIILRNYKALICVNYSDIDYRWYIVPIIWTKYIFVKNGKRFYLSNVKFCCRHNIVHETEWVDYVAHQPMSLLLFDSIRLFPSLFHYGVQKCGKIKGYFNVMEIGGVYTDLFEYMVKSHPFICGYPDFVYSCRYYGYNAKDDELSFEVKRVLSHFYLSKIIQMVFCCKTCYNYFDSFMKFMVFVGAFAPMSSITQDCIEPKIKKVVHQIDDSYFIYHPCNMRIIRFFSKTMNTLVNPFVSIISDHNHIEVTDGIATINDFNYCVSWDVSSYC